MCACGIGASGGRSDRLWLETVSDHFTPQQRIPAAVAAATAPAPLRRRRRPSVSVWTMLVWRNVLVLLACVLAPLAASEQNDTLLAGRVKRNYYDGDLYGSYYGWQAGRIVGWLLGLLVLLLVICVPCVCCVGIWFAGWFGLRQAMQRRRGRAGLSEAVDKVTASNNAIIKRVFHSDSSPSGPPGEHRVVYAHATDRYFERRPDTPPHHSSAHYLERSH